MTKGHNHTISHFAWVSINYFLIWHDISDKSYLTKYFITYIFAAEISQFAFPTYDADRKSVR